MVDTTLQSFDAAFSFTQSFFLPVEDAVTPLEPFFRGYTREDIMTMNHSEFVNTVLVRTEQYMVQDFTFEDRDEWLWQRWQDISREALIRRKNDVAGSHILFSRPATYSYRTAPLILRVFRG